MQVADLNSYSYNVSSTIEILPNFAMSNPETEQKSSPSEHKDGAAKGLAGLQAIDGSFQVREKS